MKSFAAPAKHLSDLQASAIGRLIAAASDLVLVLDADGIVRDLAFGNSNLDNEGFEEWVGKAWVQTVPKDARANAEAMLRDAAAAAAGPLEWRTLSHRTGSGRDLSLTSAAIRLRSEARYRTVGRTVVFSRDMRGIAALQQSVVDAQQENLHDHWKLRDAQSRYRQLFQTVSDAVLIVDAASQKILEANPAAVQLFGDNVRRLVGATFPTGLESRSNAGIQTLLTSLRTSGRADDVHALVAEGGGEVTVSGSVFRQENGVLLVIRLSRVAGAVVTPDRANANAVLLKIVQSAPDCIVVTDINGQIISANEAFVELVQLASEEQVRAESLGRWIGRTGVELSVLISTLRQRGSLRLFPTSLRCEHGLVSNVEISATLVRDNDEAYLGFTIRDVSRRQAPDARSARELPHSAGQLSELVGRVPMKDIVGETTDMIEQLCIEAALDLTRDNRAAAAEMLGVSRQSLYVKLRRYGLGELTTESEKE